jgi:hypothetical protein
VKLSCQLAFNALPFATHASSVLNGFYNSYQAHYTITWKEQKGLPDAKFNEINSASALPWDFQSLLMYYKKKKL